MYPYHICKYTRHKRPELSPLFSVHAVYYVKIMNLFFSEVYIANKYNGIKICHNSFLPCESVGNRLRLVVLAWRSCSRGWRGGGRRMWPRRKCPLIPRSQQKTDLIKKNMHFFFIIIRLLLFSASYSIFSCFRQDFKKMLIEKTFFYVFSVRKKNASNNWKRYETLGKK